MERTEKNDANIVALLKKILILQERASYLQKDQTNTAQNYKFVSSQAVIQKLAPIMKELGLVTLPSITVDSGDSFTGKSGTVFERLRTNVKTTIIDSDTGAWMTVDSIGEGADAGDKAAAKASTSGIKYGLIALARIATGQDPESDVSVDNETGETKEIGLPVAKPVVVPTVSKMDPPTAIENEKAIARAVAYAKETPVTATKKTGNGKNDPGGEPLGNGRFVVTVTPSFPYQPPKPGKSGKNGPYKFPTDKGTFSTFFDDKAKVFVDALSLDQKVNVIYERNEKYNDNQVIGVSIYGEVAE